MQDMLYKDIYVMQQIFILHISQMKVQSDATFATYDICKLKNSDYNILFTRFVVRKQTSIFMHE